MSTTIKHEPFGTHNDRYALGKRTYLPFVVSSTCPNCGDTAEVDMRTDAGYLSYPVLGKPEPVHFYCDGCEREWDVNVVVGFTLDVAP